MREYLGRHTHTIYLNVIEQQSVDIFATDIHVRRQWIAPEHVLSAKLYAGVMISVCKRVEFVIRSVNNLKTARYNIVNQSENGYS